MLVRGSGSSNGGKSFATTCDLDHAGSSARPDQGEGGRTIVRRSARPNA